MQFKGFYSNFPNQIVIAHIFKELKIRLFTTRGGVHYKTKEMKIDFFHTLL